jgi:hypothetical protein
MRQGAHLIFVKRVACAYSNFPEEIAFAGKRRGGGFLAVRRSVKVSPHEQIIP